MIKYRNIKIGIVGVGYVGLPLAIEFNKKRNVVCFDSSNKRVQQLRSNFDYTMEVSKKTLINAKKISFTTNPKDLAEVNCFIITVPTPINKEKKPDLSMLIDATKTVGRNIKFGDLVIYESTVFPGCTEDICVPILEKYSKLTFNKDFFCGYSPERINPGDKKRRLPFIKKIVSGSTLKVSKLVKKLYSEIIKVGIHEAASIKIAEAAKVIENTQRDLNIALINELSIIFNKLKIDTEEVLKAAESKWNFIPFRPGLVGGHCIGVDPYYLTHKAEKIGYKPKVILSGRGINNGMPKFVVKNLKNLMKKKKINIKNSKILVMGFAFKENCPDIRNSKVSEIIKYLKKTGCKIDVYDPLIESSEAIKEYNISPLKKYPSRKYDALILAVAHRRFKKLSKNNFLKLCKKNSVIYDLKYILPRKYVDLRL